METEKTKNKNIKQTNQQGKLCNVQRALKMMGGALALQFKGLALLVYAW